MANRLKYRRERREVVATAQELVLKGMNDDSGNVSRRVSGGFLITPSAIPVLKLRPEQIVFVRDDGSYDGEIKPSTEWRFHLKIYRTYAAVKAVVHCHSLFAEILSMQRKAIEVKYHYTVMKVSGDIRCIRYEDPGSQKLAIIAARGLRGRSAVLLGNHGQIAVGKDLAAASKLAGFVERSAFRQWASCVGGKPVAMSRLYERRLKEIFAEYGQGNQKLKKKLR